MASVDIPDVLVDATVPARRSHWPRHPVEVKALSVNPVDVKVRAALNHTGGEERILGWDAAGTVIAVGEQTTLFQPGDDVYYAGALERPGSYGQLQLVDERIVGPKPSSFGLCKCGGTAPDLAHRVGGSFSTSST